MGIPIDAILGRNQNLCEIYIAELPPAPGRWLIIPCLDEREEVEDVCSVELNGRGYATHLGRASILGLDLLLRPQEPGRVAVHESPLDWLKGGCDGCCVLDWANAAPILRSQPVTFLVASEAVARMLRKAGVKTRILVRHIQKEQVA
jgi:hypothetical protein